MIGANPFRNSAPRELPGNLLALEEPKHRVLAEFIHGCAPDSPTRTMAATALVLTLWQVAGRSMTSQLPSMILLNAGEAAPDPIDAVVDQLATGLGYHDSRKKGGEDKCIDDHPEEAVEAVLSAGRKRKKLGILDPSEAARIRQQDQLHQDARAAGYVSGSACPYSGAWHDEQGLITGESDTALLRLNEGPDRAAFRRHVLDEPGKLRHPEGPGGTLGRTRKTIAVSGSLTADLCDAALVEGILELGLPFFFLPHLAQDPLTVANSPALSLLSITVSNAAFAPVVANPHLPSNDWWHGYQLLLRKRLHMLPAAYEFSVQRAVRELEGVCHRIARCAAAGTGATGEEAAALFMDLHALSFRGIVLSIEGLAWHCLGFDPGCSRPQALKLLQHLREKGSMTRRDIQRITRLPTAESRDHLLDRLAAEGLVTLDDKRVTAVSAAEFAQQLHARPELPMPKPYWPEVAGEEKS